MTSLGLFKYGIENGATPVGGWTVNSFSSRNRIMELWPNESWTQAELLALSFPGTFICAATAVEIPFDPTVFELDPAACYSNNSRTLNSQATWEGLSGCNVNITYYFYRLRLICQAGATQGRITDFRLNPDISTANDYWPDFGVSIGDVFDYFPD